MKRFSQFTYAVMLTSTCSLAHVRAEDGDSNAGDGGFGQVDVSDNLSQFIRSNASHYWSYMKSRVSTQNQEGLKPYLGFQGVLAGDPHMGNFSIIPVRADGANRAAELAFLNVDFDDAGEGPFVLDFIRYEVAVKAAFDENIKRKDLEDAYIKGLDGQQTAPPTQVQQLLNMAMKDYRKMVDDYVDKKTSKKGFKLKDGDLDAYNGKVELSSIRALFSKDETVVDVAIRPVERGGSVEALRIWVLIEDRDHNRRIMELKGHIKSALNLYQKQPDWQTWLEEVRQAFWPAIEGSSYDLVKLETGELFWLREKRVSLIDVPYSSSKNEKLIYAAGLAAFDANLLGLAHGRQKDGKKYLVVINQDLGAFHGATEAIVNEYIEAAKKAYKAK
ncbi:MAG: hypothetical protein ACRD9S_24160 [Pyrinomonadaceae bacterium]